MAGIFSSEFDLGEMVAIVTDEDQKPRMITCVRFLMSGGCIYQLNCGTETTDHYTQELRRLPLPS